jgi:predicted metal-dependent phosphoesterase TrpH
MKNSILFFTFLLWSFMLSAQNMNIVHHREILQDKVRKSINLPEIPGFKTLKCDFHMHTVFSDGDVWPTVRVDEAWQEGLDVISITDHIEYTPKDKNILGDHNTSFQIAKPYADEKGIMLVKGSEITRNMPPGHFNALFLTNSNPLDTPDYMHAFEVAKKQGAFIIWNHPGWKAQQPDTCKWWDIHTELYNKGMLNAIEVFNAYDHYPVALNWCNEKNLTYIAATDIHGYVANDYDLLNYHRPMTLVFAYEKTEASLKEALFAQRTLAWYGNTLAGKEDVLSSFYKAAVKVSFSHEDKNYRHYKVTNSSEIPFTLKSSRGTEFIIYARGESFVRVPQSEKGFFEVTNMVIRADKKLSVTFP